MFLLRLFLLIMAWLVLRRLYVGWRRGQERRRTVREERGPNPAGPGASQSTDKYGNLTQQEVSDADFEEIP